MRVPSVINPGRRALLGGLGAAMALPLGAGVAAATTPTSAARTESDGELIGHCEKFDALERRLKQHSDAHPDDDICDEFAARIAESQRPFLDAACAYRATTIEGIYARARTLLLYDGYCGAPTPDSLVSSEDVNERLLGVLLRDLADLANRDAVQV